MVNISIDVTDLGGDARPGDKVVLWRPRMGGSATHAGRVISTAPVTVFLADGKATVSDVEPGEMTVLLQCRGVESQGPVTVGVPDGDHTVTLRALLESQFEYAPPIVSAVQEAAANASASERAAIEAQVRSEAAADRADAKVDDAINNGANLVRDEVKQDADRAVSARQAATQSESKAKASEGKAASSASNAATSETNAKQSETNAGDYAAVATTAATEAVDAMESASDAATSIADSVSEAAGHADRAEQSESSAAAYAQNASDAADRVGTAEQVGTWAQQAQDAADRIGTAEQVEEWADDARNSASSASQSESKAREYRDAAASAASTTVDSVRSELRGVVSEASGYATESSRSAARAKTSETNAATHEANSLSAAERAEFAAEETIQQVEGDFATRNYVDSARWQKRYLTGEDQIDLFYREEHSGAWRVNTPALASALNLPTADRGSFQVYHTTGAAGVYTNAVQMWLPSGAPALWLRTIQTSGTWSDWKEIGSSADQVGDTTKFIGYPDHANKIVRTDENGNLVVSTGTIINDYDVANKAYVDSASFARGTLTASHDLDAMADKKYAGAWQVTSTPVAESLGVPSPGFGTVIVFWAAGSSEPYYTATQWWVPAASGDMYKRSIVSRGSWTGWSKIGGSDEPIAPAGASESRANLLAASRGGRIGTGGKAVVSLRFDHNMGAFDEYILELLRERQLPATMACYYDMIEPVPGYSNDDSAAAGKTWDDIQQNFYRGVEVFSHSYSHQDASTVNAIKREVVESRAALESAMPDVRVHGWAAPGVTGTQYMGWWDVWGDPDARVKHPAGQMLASTYGTYNVSGYGLNELGKKETRYFGIESHTSASASKGHIDRAIATGTGVTLMVHPKQIGASGKMSLAVFTEVLDYIVAKRNAGEIMVLTMGGQAVTDPSTAWRHSLVPDVEGWSGSSSGTLTYDLGLSYLHDSAGAVRMLEAEVEGTGNVRLIAQDMQANAPINVYQTQSFSGGGTARIAVGIPRRSSSLRLTLECTGVTVKKVGFYGV